MQERAKRFFFHFNKPASRAAGKPRISVHYNKQCIIVDNVYCSVPTKGKIKQKQPQFVLAGSVLPSEFTVVDNIAYIGKQ